MIPRLFFLLSPANATLSVTNEFQYVGVVWRQVISAIMESVDVSKTFAWRLSCFGCCLALGEQRYGADCCDNRGRLVEAER